MKKIIAATLLALAVTACGGDDEPKLAANGEACEENDDCESGDCVRALHGCHWLFGCSSYELTDGMCTSGCEWVDDGTFEEQLQADCAEGEQCLAYADSRQICFQGCEVQEDCREDWVCTPMGGFNTCLPPDDAARVLEAPELITPAPDSFLTK